MVVMLGVVASAGRAHAGDAQAQPATQQAALR
jgi:hypothetical protein